MTIQMDSDEAQIIIDGMESALSIQQVWENKNWYRRDTVDELISKSAIYYTLLKM